MKMEIEVVRSEKRNGEGDIYVTLNLSALNAYLRSLEQQRRAEQRKEAEKVFLTKLVPDSGEDDGVTR